MVLEIARQKERLNGKFGYTHESLDFTAVTTLAEYFLHYFILVN